MPDLSSHFEDALDVLEEISDPESPNLIRVDGRETPIRVAFRQPTSEAELGALGMRRTVPAARLDATEFDAAGGGVGSELRIEGDWWEVAAFERKRFGVIVADLRRRSQ